MRIYFRFLLILLLNGSLLEAISGVNIKNGNFYMSYTDIDLTDRNGLDITRIYNSKSVDNGLFGFGWGSMLETRMFVIGDGNLVVKYWGGGSLLLYTSNRQDEELLNACIDQLVAAALENEDLENTPSDINAFRTLMRQNLTDRVNKWIKYKEINLVTTPHRLTETQWKSNHYLRQQISIQGDQFLQVAEDGTSQRFNKEGYLTASYGAGGTFQFQLIYKEGNRLSRMTDKAGNHYYFSLTPSGKIERIHAKNKSSRYWYKDDLLIRSLDAGKNHYRFDYDSAFNMISIHYTDGSSTRIEYDAVTNFCTKVTDRKGLITEYVYKFFYDQTGEVDDRHFATYVLRFEPGSAKTDSAYYEYEIRERENGEQYQYRFFRNRNGETFEEINDEQCGWPRVIRKNLHELRFTYSPMCGILRRESDSLNIEAQLDSIHQRPIKLMYYNKVTGETLTKEIELNDAGSPVRIKFRNQQTTITYNEEQQPVHIVSEQGVLLYHYDSYKRVIKVTSENTGTMNIQYDSNGSKSSVSSKDGVVVAQQIDLLYEAAVQRLKNTRIHYEFIPIIH